MRVAVLGCGSIGGVIASRLSRHPEVRLTVINRNPEIARAARQQGLVLQERGRRLVTHPLLLNTLEAEGPGFDALILATKANGLLATAKELAHRLAPDGMIITTQNGLVALDLAEVLGVQRVIPGAVLWGASMIRPGEYRLTARGPFIIGTLAVDTAAASLPRAAWLLSQAFPVRISKNIRGVLWSKLAITASFTALGAISGLSFGKLVQRASVRRMILAISREVLAVACSQGITLEPLGGGLNVRRTLEKGGYPPFIGQLLMRLIGWKHRRTESAMLDSLRRGRKTEIAFINGRVVELAAKQGIPVPWNRKVCELVRELEAGKFAPAVDLLEALEVRSV